jgi:hypothetical protein
MTSSKCRRYLVSRECFACYVQPVAIAFGLPHDRFTDPLCYRFVAALVNHDCPGSLSQPAGPVLLSLDLFQCLDHVVACAVGYLPYDAGESPVVVVDLFPLVP